MFSLRYLRFLLCSRDLDVLRAQRIMGFSYFKSNHKSRRSEKSNYMDNCSDISTSCDTIRYVTKQRIV